MKTIAFFCAEYGIEDQLYLYAGGLGILAGDYIHEAGDQGVPFVAVGLFYKGGFTVSKHDNNEEETLGSNGFQKVLGADGKPLVIDVDLANRVVHLEVWTRSYGSARLYLLDANCILNTQEDCMITRHLYDPDTKIKIYQELTLGLGGIKLLRTLGINPGIYHLNEGHTSFVALALAAEYMHDHPEETSFTAAIKAVKPQIVATKHTILSGAGIYFRRYEFEPIAKHYMQRHRIDFDEFFALGTNENDLMNFSTTRFLLRSAVRASGVSMLHTVFERQLHPNSALIPITNGVHAERWKSHLWPKEGIGILTDGEIWKTRAALRRQMIDFIKSKTGVELQPDALTIVWARRFASYKRPNILFSDPKRLESLVNAPKEPIQFVISGMAHESDAEGVAAMKRISEYVASKEFNGKVVYVPEYSISVARKLIEGADVWLNTPERGIEACGTSGMKAALNGSLECSVSDGWIGEVDWTGIGWVLPEENLEKEIYDFFEQKIMPVFYDRNAEGIPEHWIKRIRETIRIVEGRFTTKRMLEDYQNKLYFPEDKTV